MNSKQPQKKPNQISIIDETTKTASKIHKRTPSMRRKFLRKNMMNENLLKNYFVFESSSMENDELNTFKIVQPKTINISKETSASTLSKEKGILYSTETNNYTPDNSENLVDSVMSEFPPEVSNIQNLACDYQIPTEDKQFEDELPSHYCISSENQYHEHNQQEAHQQQNVLWLLNLIINLSRDQ